MASHYEKKSAFQRVLKTIKRRLCLKASDSKKTSQLEATVAHQQAMIAQLTDQVKALQEANRQSNAKIFLSNAPRRSCGAQSTQSAPTISQTVPTVSVSKTQLKWKKPRSTGTLPSVSTEQLTSSKSLSMML